MMRDAIGARVILATDRKIKRRRASVRQSVQGAAPAGFQR
jgi:hypothetical protein